MKKTIWIIIAIIVLGGITWWGQSKKQSSIVQGGPIKIGGLFSLSGYAAFAGEAARDGMVMAIEDSGMDVDYVIEDFKSEPKSLVTAASKLLDIDKVQVVIGPEWAEFGEVVAPIADKKKIVFVSPWMTSEHQWVKSPYYFSGTPNDRFKQRKFVEYLANEGIQNIAIVFSNNVWSIENIRVFKEEIGMDGEMSVVGEFKFNENINDFKTDILKLIKLKPDAIYSALSSDDAHGNFSKQAKELKINIPIYLDVGRAESPVMRDRFLSYVTGQIYFGPKEYKNMDAFELKYEKRFGRKPGAISAAVAYDMTTLVLKAMKSGAENSEDIRNYLENVKNYEGYSNTINFDALGQVISNTVVIRQITKDGYITIED